jgi:Holliday junction DNA helicase RuvA
MIASLSGLLQRKALDHVVVDVGGVGYQALVSMQTLAELPEVGQKVALLCYTHVREDVLQLFGFLSDKERQAFTLLISVSGVGPKLALTVLSGLPVDQLVVAITASDIKRLQGVPGVGKKTAERLVVELKDKLTRIGLAPQVAATKAAKNVVPAPEVVEALANLGYRRAQAERAVKEAVKRQPDAAIEKLLRTALAVINEA